MRHENIIHSHLRVFCCTALCVSNLFVGIVALGADDPIAFQPADTSSPRATLKSFIDSVNELYRRIQTDKYLDRGSPEFRPLARRILDCLDVSELPDFAKGQFAGEVAVCLKEVLDRVELPPWDEIPDTKAIENTGSPDGLSRWRIPGTRITIGRIEQGPQRHQYLFTSGTVDRAVEYYQDMRYLPYRTTGLEVSRGLYRWYFSAPGHPLVAAVVDRLPEWSREQRFGLTVWKWQGILLALLMSVLLMAVTYRLQNFFTTRWMGKGLFWNWLTIVFPLAAVLIPIGFAYVADHYLTVRGTPLYIIQFGADLTAFLTAIVVVIGISNRIAETIIASPRIHPKGLDAQLIRILSKLLSLLAAATIFLEGGRYLGIPITTLLAGAGIGGLAVALAAQSTLKDLLGTMMILLDKPYRVGERIILKQYDGIVDEIGLRSTKLRLLTGHMASIPNDLMAHTEIENVGRRPYIRRVSDIRIPLDTPREKVEQAIAEIRTALDDHEGMVPEFPPRVYFNDFNPDSFNIRVIYWYTPPNYWDFLAFSEKINMAIMRAFAQRQIKFSLPLRITETTKNPPGERS